MLLYVQNKHFRRKNMTQATKHVLERKAQLEAKRNIHDVAAATVENERKVAKEQGKEYSREDANRDRISATLAMQGINYDYNND